MDKSACKIYKSFLKRETHRCKSFLLPAPTDSPESWFPAAPHWNQRWQKESSSLYVVHVTWLSLSVQHNKEPRVLQERAFVAWAACRQACVCVSMCTRVSVYESWVSLNTNLPKTLKVTQGHNQRAGFLLLSLLAAPVSKLRSLPALPRSSCILSWPLSGHLKVTKQLIRQQEETCVQHASALWEAPHEWCIF